MGNWNSINSFREKGKSLVKTLTSDRDHVVKLRRINEAEIDSLTGDPIYTSGNSFTDYRLPCTVSELNEYASRIDREWTGQLFKKIVIYVSLSPVILKSTDIFFVTYGDVESPYKVTALRKFNGRWRVDLERVDRSIE